MCVSLVVFGFVSVSVLEWWVCVFGFECVGLVLCVFDVGVCCLSLGLSRYVCLSESVCVFETEWFWLCDGECVCV